MSIYAFEIPQNDSQFRPLLFEGYFSPEECDTILSLYKNEETWSGGTVDNDGSNNIEDEVRRVDINTVEHTPDTDWIYAKMCQLVYTANQEYKFDLIGFMENMQLLNYIAPPNNETPGGHYQMHSDTGSSYLSTRKLTVILQLTDPSEYEGCETHLYGCGDISQGRGDVSIFPSSMLHGVSEMTEGHREALVVWVNGPPFR